MSHLDSALGLANLAPLLTADLLVLRRVPSTSYQFSKDLLNEWIVFWESLETEARSRQLIGLHGMCRPVHHHEAVMVRL